MTSSTLDATPRCFICDQPGTVHLVGTVYSCHDHAQGEGRLYLKEGHIE